MGMGDDIMVTAAARAAQAGDPRRVRVVNRGRWMWSPVWDNNPRLARPHEVGDFQLLQTHGPDNQRPYHTAKTPERWSYNPAFRAEPGELHLSEKEEFYAAKRAGAVYIEPHIKPGASPNKQWGWERWQELVERLLAAGIRVKQLSQPGTRCLNGVEMMNPPSFRHACALLSTARAAVLPEGGLHHAAAALGTPAVVIFGGFTPVELTGYAGHVNLGSGLGDACGMRVPCEHCKAAMEAITPERVADALMGLLKGEGRDAR